MGKLRSLSEVLKGLKHERLGKPSPKVCPKCGNAKIKLSSGFDTYPRMYGITPGKYVCEECGYNGSIAVELEETG